MTDNISNLSDFRKVTYPGISENRYMVSSLDIHFMQL